jgi:hypothetical protein
MGFIVTIRFKGDPKKANQVLRDDPELYKAVHEGIYEHGLERCWRYINDEDGEFLDVDEWPSEAERNSFMEAHREDIAEWVRLSGIKAEETRTWRTADEDEVF